MRHAYFFGALAFGILGLGLVSAQSPGPVIIQAATPAPVRAAVTAPVASAAAGSKVMLQSLQEMQKTNADTIKRQEAALEALDALQKAAEEIKIYSKRG